jgi:hypothetical protein
VAKTLEDLAALWNPDPNRLARADVQSAMKTAQSILGYPGRMMSASKSGYNKNYPANVAVFNSNVVTEKLGKIWFGDIDLTLDGDKLKALAETLGEKVYVLREMAARFENENSPQLDKSVAIFEKDNIIFGTELKIYGREEYQVEICKLGRYAGKMVYKKEFRR